MSDLSMDVAVGYAGATGSVSASSRVSQSVSREMIVGSISDIDS